MAQPELWLEPEVYAARDRLPGNVRQRLKRTIDGLIDDPRPPRSRTLDVTGLDVPPGVELRRVRIERWRIVYAVNDDEGWIWVLGIRRRPPYDYEDLEPLIARLE